MKLWQRKTKGALLGLLEKALKCVFTFERGHEKGTGLLLVF